MRFDFYYSCAYCSTSEIEATGIAFEVDHYKPQKTGDADVHEYINLMWSCEHCNSGASKGDFWPTAAQMANRQRLLRPDQDNLPDHYSLNGSELVALTPEATASITILRLNRATLLKLRNIRERLYQSRRAVIAGIQALQGLSLDECPIALKPKLQQIRREMNQRQADLAEALDACTVRAFNHSPMLDLDPTKQAQLVERRAYLESIKALVPPSPIAPPTIP